MPLFPIQIFVSVLIAGWGLVMLVLGGVWMNPVWVGLGVAVALVGLPFLRNLLPDRR